MLRRLLHRGHDDSRALSRYWDEIVHQSPVTPMPVERTELDLRTTIRSLHGLAEAERESAPFAEPLLRQVQAQREEYLNMHQQTAILPLPGLRPTGGPDAPLHPRTVREHRDLLPSRLTAAAVIAIALIASLLITMRSGDDRHNPAIFVPTSGTPAATPSPQATPAAAELTLDWTSYSNQGAEFSSPNNMAVAPNGDLWIVDAGNNRIKILGPDGKYKETWGEFGTGDSQINFFRLENTPLAAVGSIASAPDGSFYIADTGNTRIQKFDKDRNFVLSWSEAASPGIGLQEPIGVQVDLDGNVLVLDATIGKVYKYSPDGKYLARFDKVATGIAQHLGQGGCITQMTDGTILVCDGIGGVRKYQPDGTLVGTIHPKDANGNLLRSTNDIAVDGEGNLYYLDMDGKTLYVFDLQGALLTTWTGEGSDALFGPTDVTVGPDGVVYIVDYQAIRVQRLTATLPWPATCLDTPAGDVPAGDARARLWVGDDVCRPALWIRAVLPR